MTEPQQQADEQAHSRMFIYTSEGIVKEAMDAERTPDFSGVLIFSVSRRCYENTWDLDLYAAEGIEGAVAPNPFQIEVMPSGALSISVGGGFRVLYADHSWRELRTNNADWDGPRIESPQASLRPPE